MSPIALLERINMQKKYIETKSKETIIEIRELLKECVEFNNLLDWNFVTKNIEKITAHKEILSDEEMDAIKHIFEEVILPTFFDKKKRDDFFNEEFGYYNEEGHFVIDSEESIDKISSLIFKRCVELGKQIDKYFFEIWNLEFD